MSGARTAAWSPWPPVIYGSFFYFVVSRSALRSFSDRRPASGRRSGCWRCGSARWRSGLGTGRSAGLCRAGGAGRCCCGGACVVGAGREGGSPSRAGRRAGAGACARGSAPGPRAGAGAGAGAAGGPRGGGGGRGRGGGGGGGGGAAGRTNGRAVALGVLVRSVRIV